MIYLSIIVCLWPTDPARTVCNGVTLLHPYPSVDICIEESPDAMKEWAKERAANFPPFAVLSRYICGPESKGTHDDVPQPEHGLRKPPHLPRLGPPTWELEGKDI